MEQQGAGRGEAKMEYSRVSETDHRMSQKIQEFSSTTITWEGEAVVAFCWGENEREQNGSAVARQGLLPVTTPEYFLI